MSLQDVAGHDRGLEPIAIVGSSCRFPGGVSSPSELWDLLRQPWDVLSEIPRSRFNTDKFYHPDTNHSGKMNVRHSYLLKQDPRSFDAQFFGIKPLEANAVDPQQRLLLETTYNALEDAGIPLHRARGSRTGVFIGLMTEDYSNIIGRDLQNVPTYFASGTARSIISNRVSYVFDLHGPSMTIDTACSSSLVALHLAVQSLRSGESDCALVGGSNLLLSPEQYIAGTKLKLFSPTGRSRMWDTGANGYGRGEGVAVLVLKTLSQALSDGDSIECLVRETGVNQDGKTKGITMPSAEAQIDLIKTTYARSGLDLSRPSARPQYFEAHGTGTPAGDPIEAEAISKAVFGYTNHQQGGSQPLYVGSIKTVLGHAESAAGVAGVMKASLAVQHGVLPPNMLLDELSEAVKPFYSNLRVLQAAQNWPAVSDGPRRASVNSFGFGGTNAHAILEQFMPVDSETPSSQPETTPMSPFNFSAASEKSLRANLVAYADFLKDNPSIRLRDLAWTLNVRKSTLSTRTSIVALTAHELEQKLRRAALETTFNSPTNSGASGSILAIFTGQGAQWATMGLQLFKDSVLVQDCFQKLQAALDSLSPQHAPDWKLCEELFKDRESSRLGDAAISQPLCTAVQLAVVDVLMAAKVKLTAVVGHSSGEIAAAYAAGYLTAESAIRIAYYRGLFLDMNNVSGQMLAVGTTQQDAQELCELPLLEGKITIAAYNSTSSVTLSGDSDAVREAKEILEDEQKFARILKVNKAYHSHHMKPFAGPYAKALEDIQISVQKPGKSHPAWISTVVTESAATMGFASLAHRYWADNMVRPVRFLQAVEYATGSCGPFDAVIEVGPHPVLRGPTTDTLREIAGKDVPYIPTLVRDKNDSQAFAGCLGSLWKIVGDSAVDFSAFEISTHGPQVAAPKVLKDLPSYAWDHDHQYWHETRYTKAFLTGGDAPHPLLGTICPAGTAHEVRFRNYLSPQQQPWLSDHRIQGQVVFPAAAYVSSVLEAVAQLYPDDDGLVELANVHIGKAMVFRDNETPIESALSVRILEDSTECLEADFTFCSEAVEKGSTQMVENARGRIRVIRKRSLKSLPVPASPIGEFVNVTPERFYNWAGEEGYGYEGAFRGLKDTQRTMNQAVGSIAISPDTKSDGFTIAHPGILDCALQAVLLAYSYPGDGRLRSVYLPTKIDLIRVAMSGWRAHSLRPNPSFPFFASVDPHHGGAFVGDVDIHSAHDNHVILQLQGLHGVALEPPSPTNDAKLFIEKSWGPELLQVSTNWNSPICSSNQDLGILLERVAGFYLRRLAALFPLESRNGLLWHHSRLLDYADHCLTSVDGGIHPWVRREWNMDTEDEITSLTHKYTMNTDLEILRVVGEGLHKALRGELNLLETVTNNGLLRKYYRDALGMKEYLGEMARVMHTVSHKFSNINILEIGAGTGAATTSVLAGIGDAFESYTFTDISSGFFGEAQAEFASHQPKMVFKTLDIEKPVADQGFTEAAYDVVVASLVLHATQSLETTLSNVRKLLRPGGYLIILEVTDNTPLRLGLIFGGMPGWWLGDGDHRKFSPCVSISVWGDLVSKTGFSSIRTMAPASKTIPVPLSLMVTQAVDDRVNFLIEPLDPTFESLELGSVVIVGGHATSRELAEAVRKHYKTVDLIPSMHRIGVANLPLSATVVCMADLEGASIFQDLKEPDLTALQAIFSLSQTVIWVSTGAHGNDPAKAMYIGLQRTLALELAHVQMQSINFERQEDVSSQIIAAKLLQTEAYGLWERMKRPADLLWHIEPELTVRHGRVMVPRMRLANARNERYNAARRQLTKEAPVGSTLAIVRRDSELHLEEMKAAGSAFGGQILFTHSVLRPVRAAESALFVSLGLTDTGQRVLALSDSLRSTISVPSAWAMPAPDDVGDALICLLALHTQLVARYILDRAPIDGKAMLIVSPPRHLGDVLGTLAAARNITLCLVTTDPAIGSIGYPWAFVHPFGTKRSAKGALPTAVGLLLDMDEDKEVGAVVRACLPTDCQEITLPELAETFPRSNFSPHSIREVSDNLSSAWMGCQVRDLPPWAALGASQISLDDITAHRVPTNVVPVVSWESDNRPQIQIQPSSKLVTFRPDKCYWLVGLKSSLGLSLCKWMAEHGARHIAISSRTPAVKDSWIKSMTALGCNVKLFDGDITDSGSVQNVYRRITASMPPIAGVVQGAMVLQDTVFPELTINAWEEVTKPKVKGSIYLDETFTNHTLDFFIFLSSVAYLAGNAGQGAYSAANAFMTSLAAQRRRRGLAASVIHLGAVVGVGYITRELTPEKQRALYEAGYSFLSEQDFHEIFAEAILASQPDSGEEFEISTGLRLESTIRDTPAKWARNPMLQHLVTRSDKHAVFGKDRSNVSVKALLLEATTSEQQFEALKDGIIGKLQAVLRFDRGDSILELSPDELGIDSLVALDIQSWFRTELNVDFPILKLLNAPSVREIILATQRLLLEASVSPIAGTSTMDQEQNLPSSPSGPSISMSSSNTATTTPSPTMTPKTDSQGQDLDVSSEVLYDSCSRKQSQVDGEGNVFERMVPLSFAQSRFWFLRSFAEDPSAFNITSVVKLRGRIDIHRLRKALEAVGQRHEALRTAFYTDSATKKHMQGILPTMVSRLETATIQGEHQVEKVVREYESHVYDLLKGETLRLTLLSFSETAHRLVFGYHHIVLDGLGFQIFFTDLENAFTGTLNTTASDVLQYPDYSLRQMQEYRNGSWSQELKYWKQQFSTIPEPIQPLLLSLRHSRLANPSFRTHSIRTRLDEALQSQIVQTCRHFQVKPFHFFTTVFVVLLSRYGNTFTEDLCIGVADGNRSDLDTAGNLGLFLNLLPLRFRQHSELSFAKALLGSRSTIEDAYGNSRVPFDVLLGELNIPRSPTHMPLFQVFLNYRQNIHETTTFCGCEAQGEIVSGGRNAYDVSLDIVDSNGQGSLITVTVNADLYDGDGATAIQNSYLSLLQAFAQNPAARICWPSLHPEESVKLGISRGRGPELGSKWPPTVVDRIDSMMRSYTEKPALTDGAGGSLSYGELASRIHSIAAQLVSRGVKRGSRVGIFQMPGTAWVCSLLAVLRTGAACVPLDLNVGISRLSLLVKDCIPQVLLVDESTLGQSAFVEKTTALILEVSTLSSPQHNSDQVPNRAQPHDDAIITYTSGSTGIPKGVVVRHHSYQNFFEFTLPRWGIAEGNVTVLQQSAYAFDISILQILTSLCYGGTLVIPDNTKRRDPTALCDLIAWQGITMTFATPTEYISWAKHGIGKLHSSKWRCAMTGGEPMTSSLLEVFKSLAKTNLRLINCYGPTEASIGCADRVVDYNKSLDSNLAMSVLPNYKVVVVDDDLRPVAAGVPGQILIGGAGVAAGYLNQPEVSAEAFVVDQWGTEWERARSWTRLHLSGDRGRLTLNGELLLHGRIGGSTQIKVRGVRIDLVDIENTIIEAMSPHVVQAVVSRRETPETGVDFLVAFVVLSGKDTGPPPDDWLANFPDGLPLPLYMRPALAIVVDRLPRMVSGKIDRAAVDSISLQPSSARTETKGADTLSEMERDLMSLWREVIPREVAWHRKVHSQSDFFQLGGNSLALVDLQGLIKERLHTTVPIYRLFESATLGRMTILLERGRTTSVVSQAQPVDWDHETQVSAHVERAASEPATNTSRTSGPANTIVLTGSTGFLGQELLSQLVSNKQITRVHCIAVRKPKEQLPTVFTDSKVSLHFGDLGGSYLGLQEGSIRDIFSKADVALHVGADVSFLKSYDSLKLVNVASTKELARLCAARNIPLHFVSSATVARLAGKSTFGPHSVRQYPPPQGTDGYTASKWVSEVYLENASRVIGLPVYIHRPSSITGPGAPNTDLTANLVQYARQTKTLPDLGSGGGYFDFISVQTTARMIIEEMARSIGKREAEVRYLHESGEVQIATDDAESILGLQNGEPFEVVTTPEWIQRATDAGMDPLLALYLRRTATKGVLFPRLLRGD